MQYLEKQKRSDIETWSIDTVLHKGNFLENNKCAEMCTMHSGNSFENRYFEEDKKSAKNPGCQICSKVFCL